MSILDTGPAYDDFQIRMLKSGVYRYCGVHGYEKGQVFDANEELMSPRLAIEMVRLGWAEVVKEAV